MKTTTSYNEMSEIETLIRLKKIIKTIIFLLLFFFVFLISNAQNQFGVGISTRISGNGFGTTHGIKLMYKHNRSIVGISSLIQQQNYNLCGIQVSYEYTLFGNNISYEKNRLELFCFLNSSYNNGFQKKSQQRNQDVNSDNNNVNINNKLRTIENYGGFGLRLKISQNFSWINSIGFGHIYAINSCCFKYVETNATAILLRTGFSYSFNVHKKNKIKTSESSYVSLIKM